MDSPLGILSEVREAVENLARILEKAAPERQEAIEVALSDVLARCSALQAAVLATERLFDGARALRDQAEAAMVRLQREFEELRERRERLRQEIEKLPGDFLRRDEVLVLLGEDGGREVTTLR